MLLAVTFADPVEVDPLKKLSVTLELASALPLIVGVVSCVILLLTISPLSSVICIEFGAFGAVLSLLELDDNEPLPPGKDSFPANVSKGT